MTPGRGKSSASSILLYHFLSLPDRGLEFPGLVPEPERGRAGAGQHPGHALRRHRARVQPVHAGVLPKHGSNPAAPGTGPDHLGRRDVQPSFRLVLAWLLPASLGPAADLTPAWLPAVTGGGGEEGRLME